ncbi:HU family DNA-binding protein [Porphyromonas gulae]|uniref:DNA-binding protein n=1 Tax=Porphyromonas gulae TaxID=111105 RepID=A0A0A2F4H3_9PORP|nr:DNA-binding protein [Porphyromonas gulae]KGN85911.1 DNA-binding protein [Porphyromonas gulae]
MGKNKPLAYVLREREMSIGKFKGQIVQVASPTDRHSVSFERFCEMVAKETTFNYMEVASVLNLAADMARDLVANGDMVEFGRLGKLKPSFKSKVVPKGEEFNANIHITEAKVTLRPNSEYFRLDDVSFERVAPRTKKVKPTTPGSGESSSDTQPGNDHAGL